MTTGAANEPELRERAESSRHVPRAVWAPCVAVAAASALIGVIGLRGADYPAQLLRALLWERAGVSVWNTYWYGGHATPTYSIIAPPIAAWIGPFPLVVIGSIVATYCFARLTTTHLPGRSTGLANLAFAVCTLVNVVVGRGAFTFGLALALVTLWVWHRSAAAAGLTTLLTSLASPVAGTFLAIATFAVGADRLLPDRHAARAAGTGFRPGSAAREAIVLTGVALAPLAVLGAMFSSAGRFPFRGDQLIYSLTAIGVVALAVPARAMRIGALCAAAASVVLFVVPNPLGGNFLRLTHSFALPLAATALPAVRRSLRPAFGVLLLAGTVWSLQPGFAAVREWVGDASNERDYHQPLINEIRRRNMDGRPVGRLEIPFTESHWEAYFVAPEVPYARGWERQVDLHRNGALYEPDLTADDYRAWLLDNAVRWIAVPDTVLDEGGQPEADLVARIAASTGWLHPVWRNAHWQLYEVVDYRPIVDPPGELVHQRVDRIVVSIPGPGALTIRYAFTERFGIDGGACVEQVPADDAEARDAGWILARFPGAGTYTLAVEPTAAVPLADRDLCP